MIAVTDDHHFRNEECLLYQFALDLERRRLLSDVAKVTYHRSASDISQDRRSSPRSSFSSLELPEEQMSSSLKIGKSKDNQNEDS